VLDPALGQFADLLDQRGRLAGQHAPAMRGGRHTLAGPKDADVVAEREGRGRPTAAHLAESRQLVPAGAQLGGRTIDRMPGGAELRRAAKCRPAVAADPDRRVRLLHGLGLERESAELRVLAGERRRARGPQLLHRLHVFIGHGAALGKRHAQHRALGGHPAGADAEHDPATAQRVQ
jgi:hypothetical protein